MQCVKLKLHSTTLNSENAFSQRASRNFCLHVGVLLVISGYPEYSE